MVPSIRQRWGGGIEHVCFGLGKPPRPSGAGKQSRLPIGRLRRQSDGGRRPPFPIGGAVCVRSIRRRGVKGLFPIGRRGRQSGQGWGWGGLRLTESAVRRDGAGATPPPLDWCRMPEKENARALLATAAVRQGRAVPQSLMVIGDQGVGGVLRRAVGEGGGG
ncbi:hypothetical protein chiPu_0022624 [Chiloscyllium punctatum]|uniref:Uncharacterized protein n=1 Tax=Chiloscyllium punctatum TaxID=137246 RepID=A0A401RH56_CHIPU|nr:hypothetical protein [Chiloscyllium punctatum]